MDLSVREILPGVTRMYQCPRRDESLKESITRNGDRYADAAVRWRANSKQIGEEETAGELSSKRKEIQGE